MSACSRSSDMSHALRRQGPSDYSTATPAAWSAFRESSFGHGLLDVSSSTKAVWSWVRNQDNVTTTADSVRTVPRLGLILAPLQSALSIVAHALEYVEISLPAGPLVGVLSYCIGGHEASTMILVVGARTCSWRCCLHCALRCGTKT